MKFFFRIFAAAAAASLAAVLCSCDSKSSENTDTVSKTAASDESSAPSETTLTDSTTTAATDISSTSTTVTSTPTTASSQKATEAPQKGFATCIDAARAYYNAYLSGNADTVYDMFCPEEIEGYHAYLDTSKSELLEGKNAQVLFKRSKVCAAINESIKRIHSIMAEKSDVPPDKWTTSIDEQLLKPTDENALKDFNKQIGTSFTSASGCGYVYYNDGNEEHVFLGNSCGFVELDGRWYLSYTTVMNCELITYIDIFR